MNVNMYLNNLAALDIIIVVVYLLICIGIGYYHLKTIKTDKDFCTLRAGKMLPLILICTIFATAIGGGTIIGYINEIYQNPIVLFFIITQPFFWIITSKIITSGLYKFKDCTTLTQIMGTIFGKSGKIITFYAVIVDCILMTSMQIIAFSAVAQYFFKVDLWQGVAIGIVIINIYSILGGLRGIIAIDVLQFLIFFLIIPVSYIITIKNLSFTGNFINSISLSNFHIEFSLPILIGLLTSSMMPEIAAPFVQRYLMLADNIKGLKSVFRKLFMISIPFMFSICLIAYLIITKSVDNSISSNVIFNYIEWLPLGVKGLMISGLFAIMMSTADSYMNATSIIISNDLIKFYFPKIGVKKLLFIMRGIIIVISLCSVLIITFQERLFQLMLILRNFGTYIIVVPLAASLLGYKISKNQFLRSFLFSILFIIITILLFDKYPLFLTFTGVLGSFIGLIWNKSIYKNSVIGINKLYIFLRKFVTSSPSKMHQFCYTYVLTKIDTNIKLQPVTLHNFSLFIFSYYFIFSLYLDDTKNLLPYLIIVGYALVLIFLLKDIIYIDKFLKKYNYLYYYLCITFCLPFVSSYMLLYYTAPGQENSIWIINSLLTTFLLYQFLNSVAFIVSITIGFLSGYILYIVELKTVTIGYSSYLVFYIYLFLLFISQIIARDKEKKSAIKEHLQKEKLTMVQAFGEMIVHEIKTPVSITSMQSNLFKKVLDNLEKDSNTGGEYTMNMENYKLFKSATNMLVETSKYGLNTVENLLVSLRGPVKNKVEEVVLIKDVVNASIKEYSIYIPELKNIKVEVNDNFKIKYSFNSLKHVIINLIKNSCIHNGSNVKIEIKIENNKLFFKDYGSGIKKEIIKKIFDKFYTQSKSGTGIGLSFCKLIMEDIGGSIECESIEGKYTNFILEFPKEE